MPPYYCSLRYNLKSTRKVITFAWFAAKITPSFLPVVRSAAKCRFACCAVCVKMQICLWCGLQQELYMDLNWSWVCFVETEWLLSDWLLEIRMVLDEILWIMIIKLTPVWRINFLLNNLEQ